MVPLESLHWLERRMRDDRAALAMENALLAQQVRDLGGEPVSKRADEWLEMYRSCAKVMRAAHEAVALLGTSKELLADKWT
jgi:hypothetical protein